MEDYRTVTAYDRWLKSLTHEQLIYWHKRHLDLIDAARSALLDGIALPVDLNRTLKNAAEAFEILDEDEDDDGEAELGMTREQWFEWDKHGEGGAA